MVPFPGEETTVTLAPPITIGGVDIANASLDQAVMDAIDHACEHDGTCLRFTNTWCIVLADRDSDYKALLNTSGINFADGRPVADEISRRGGARDSHVRGPSFFETMLDRGRERGLRHFFYGADEATLARLVEVVASRYPGAQIAGVLAPPIGSAEQLCAPELLRPIADAAPDIVWVGLGTPKQDFVATRISADLGITAAAVGAAFDFLSGTKSTAPVWMRRARLEWLFRFLSEPRRLWERYTVGIVDYLRIVQRDGRRLA